MAELPYDANMPAQFVVKRQVGDREGYIFFKSNLAQAAGDAQPWRKISPGKHLDRYYNILHTYPQTDWKRCNIVKNGGNVKREIQWRHSTDLLSYSLHVWPVLSITGFQHFPAWHAAASFAPILNPAPAEPIPILIPPENIPAQITIKIYPIRTIPQHAIRALLTQAVFNDEQCPIMDVPIDVSNGAVTSCFHIFEKNALDRWLKQPNSGQKCPVCNQPCNSYTLTAEEPEDDGVVEITGEA